MRKTLILLFALMAVFSAQAQTTLEKAGYFYEDHNYVEAAQWYQKSVDKIKNATLKAEIYYKIGNCYFVGQNFTEAEKWYQKASDLNCKIGQLYINLGDIYMNAGKAKPAAFNYDLAKGFDSSLIRKADIKIKNCNLSTKFTQKPSVLLHQNIQGVNTKLSDYGPVYLGDKIVYTSAVADSKDPVDNSTGHVFSKLFMASKEKGTDAWKLGDKLPEAVNSAYNNGGFTFDSKNSMGYFTQCNGFDGKGKTCKIYAIKYNDKTASWGIPEAINFSSDDYSVAHPAISSDGKTMIYSSDKPGGWGGKDLYMSSKGAGNTWSEPKNLGRKINTMLDEAFPNISGDTLLYFSSDGQEGIGGLDIYKSKIGSGFTFEKVKALDMPFNSSADDFNFVLSPDSKFEGFYCSNRPGGFGADDIYGFILDPRYKQVTGYLREEKTNLPIANATVKLKGTDGKDIEVKTDGTGKFELQDANPEAGYTIFGNHENYFAGNTSIEALNLSSDQDQEPILKKRNSVQLNLAKITKEEIKLDNIYYEYNSYLLTEPSKVELMKLVKLLVENPNVSIVINAHSDEQGSDKYNLKLSDKRAESVVTFLVEQGIARARLTFKGWGETNPVFKNAKNEEEHAGNRRTTFAVTNVSN